jgi:hypothetical protein
MKMFWRQQTTGLRSGGSMFIFLNMMENPIFNNGLNKVWGMTDPDKKQAGKKKNIFHRDLK